MYFKDNNNTNIDDEFENNNIISNTLKFLKKYIIIIIISLLIIIGIIIILTIKPNNNLSINKTNYYLELYGEDTITIYENSDYIEPGYNAYNSNNDNLNKEVKINSNLNTKTIGEYEITYTIDNIIKTRKIVVIEKPKTYTFIRLNGIDNSINIYLKLGEKYIEPGYQVFSTTGKNLNDKVKITGNIDTNKKGTYTLVYTLTDEYGITISSTRNIIVMDTTINLSTNITEYTNQDISINISIDDEFFDYLILPDNTKITSKKYTYKVASNGKYTFKTYNKKGLTKEESITINNIDKTPPTGSCSGYYENNKSIIKVTSNDNIGIKKYEIDGTSYNNNQITINKEITTATIKIYDTANNTKIISCNLEATYDKPIDPSGNKIIKNISTNTLKVWIEEYTTYYVSHIWAKNPYNQFKSAVPENFGNQLQLSKSILTKEITKRNLEKKAIIAINASGFVLNGTWDQTLYNANHEWNKTSVSPIVIVDGKVLRDFSTKKIPTKIYTTYGLKKDGNLGFYYYKAGTNLQDNINLSKKIINDGVLYTFGFSPVLVDKGKNVAYDTEPNIRQGLCQIDKNNFVIITNKANRSNGFNIKKLADYMITLGCTTGFNLDGGLSTALYVKDNTNNITTIASSSRAIADIIYFHEQ